MTTDRRRAAGGYLRFLAEVAGVTAGAALVGSLPTWWLGGRAALSAMAAGCVIGLLGSALGGVPIALGRREPGADPRLSLLPMAVRLGVVAVLGTLAVLSGRIERTPLLLWIAIVYAVQLVVDTRYALGAFRSKEDKESLETR